MSRILEFIKDGYHASFEILRGQRRQLITPFIIDIAFLYVIGFITAAFGNKVTEYAVQLGFLVSSRSGNLTQQYVSSSIPQMMAANPQIASSVYTLILLFSLSSLAAFVLFLSLESFSFWLILKQFLGLMLGFALVVPCLIFVRVVMAKGVRKLVGLTSKE